MRLTERLRLLARDSLAPLGRVQPPAWLGPLGREPLIVLAPLLLVQWAALVALALTVRHNGWLYYQGGDQTFYYTTAWLLSDWTLPTTPIGYGWSYLLSPIALFAGPNVLSALPVIVLLNTLVLLPVALLCIYGIGARIGGRLLGYWAAALWIAVPYAAIPLFDQRYHEKYVEITLPQTLGLSALADFPSTVCVLVAAYFTLRALDSRDWGDAALAGLAAGFAVGIKPANGLFLLAPPLALLLARRWHHLLVLIAAMAPALVTLAIWKERGLGRTPALAEGLYPLAAAVGALPPASLFDPLGKYVDVDWGMLRQNLDVLREFFWAVRPLEWVPVAGVLAVARRSPPKAALVGVWFFAYLLVKGTDPHSRVEDGSFFRLVMPSFPAYVLLATAIPLLVPTFGAALAERFPLRASRLPGVRTLAGVALVFVLIPLVFAVATRQQQGPSAVKYFDQGVFVPIDEGLRLSAGVAGRRVRLSWRHGERPAELFYTVFRSSAEPGAPPDGIFCLSREEAPGAADCSLQMSVVAVTSELGALDRPPLGSWNYRVGVSANWRNDRSLGDIMMLSRPAGVTVR